METTNTRPDKKLLDDTIYLASLASERQVIEPLLEVVRSITANYEDMRQLHFTYEEKQQLGEVQAKITEYLVSKDPMRRFTPAELDDLLQPEQDKSSSLLQRRPALALVGVWALSLAMFLAAFSVPLPVGPADKASLSSPWFYIGLHSGMAWFYLSALKRFTPSLQRAYRLIVTAILITGVGIGQFSVSQFFRLGMTVPLFRYGGLLIFYALACVCFFWGALHFSRQVKVKTAISWRMAGLGTVGAVFVSILVGHMLARPYEWSFDFALLNTLVIILYASMASFLAWRTAMAVTKNFSAGLRWLSAALVGEVVSTVAFLVCLLGGVDMRTGLPLFLIPMYIVNELLMLQAGYTFKKRSIAELS